MSYSKKLLVRHTKRIKIQKSEKARREIKNTAASVKLKLHIQEGLVSILKVLFAAT